MQASTHRKCQRPEHRWGLIFKADWFQHMLCYNIATEIPDLFKITGTIGVIFTDADFPLSELIIFWNKFVWRKGRKI